MESRIEIIPGKKLAGKHLMMSLADNQTARLWQSFMPERNKFVNRTTDELISLQVYPEPLRLGDMNQSFEKWAAVELSDFVNIPEGIETLLLPEGLYAIFHYTGYPYDTAIFRYIFGEWLPQSDYEVDNRPHFEVLGAKYRNNDPESEEDIYIPIRLKPV